MSMIFFHSFYALTYWMECGLYRTTMLKNILTVTLLTASYLSVNAAVQPTAADAKHLEAYGWIIGTQSGLTQLGLSAEEIKFVLQGVQNAAAGQKSPVNLQEINTSLQTFLQQKAMAYQEKRQKQLAAEGADNRKAASPFFAKLEKDRSVKKSSSGLFYEIISMGDANNKASDASVVKIDYVGTLINGNEFDSSKTRGEPATFSLSRVIAGFKEGLQLVGKGGKIKLYIPADLAYGDQDIPGIPPGSTLIFDVDMLDILPAEAGETQGESTN